MQIPDFRLAFRALDEELIDKADLVRLISVLENWNSKITRAISPPGPGLVGRFTLCVSFVCLDSFDATRTL